MYKDTDELTCLSLFLYKKGSACKFWCISNPKLIMQSIAVDIEHSNGIFLPPGFFPRIIYIYSGGARGIIDIVVGNELGDTSSNPGRD